MNILNELDDVIGVLAGRLEKAEAGTKRKDSLAMLLEACGYGNSINRMSTAMKHVELVREIAAKMPEEEREGFLVLHTFVVSVVMAVNTNPQALKEITAGIRRETEGTR